MVHCQVVVATVDYVDNMYMVCHHETNVANVASDNLLEWVLMKSKYQNLI